MKKKLLATLFMAGALTSHAALAEVQYQIKITNAAQHLAEVKVDFPAVTGKTLDVQMPIWRTGRYEVLNLGKNVRQFVATNGKGKQLSFAKTDKGTWQIKTQPGDTVKISYEIYANALGERTQHIDDTHAYLDASGVLMYAAPFRSQAISVKLDTPANWISRSGMDKGNCDHCFVAKNYDVLIDSPIETGEHEFHRFDVDGHEIELAIWGRGNYDGKKMAADLKKVVEEGRKLFGAFPFKRYLFIVHATDGVGGATEHINSTVIQKPRWGFAPRKEYLNFIRTAAHEFVHTWNVKAYRPKEMVPYEYQKENYTRLLWMAEGNTSYFEELLTMRAGLQTRDEMLEEFAKALFAYEHQPGRFYQSASESSFDAWIDAGGERARNASVNIYSKGQLLATAMDILIREQTKGAKGFEHVHQYLYQHHTVEKGGYSEADVRAALKYVTGKDWSDWWAKYVDGTAEIPFTDILNQVGLKYTIEGGKDDEQKEEWFTGWRTRDTGDHPVVIEVERDSPAWKSGVVAGDTLIAANGLRLTPKDINDKLWLSQQTPIKLTLFRRDELRELSLTPTRQVKGKAKLKTVENVSDTQKDLNSRWLGVAWPTPKVSPSSNTEKAKD
ncbi:M61 family metallopeptidase [Undibacterium fentianense]|uniref:M61 family metallopeptidase n=1 Tax=Undibacterium fentianense TaxID=2828728 RepID=A0A941E085_9BURK|nr:PDZ domain-containing protein [Undibacterium fentianense]MBR7800035.1 M61 family metallopeptidase [Undibacterium fentianense]